MPALGLKKTQSDAISRSLAAGNPSSNGLVLSALQGGMLENFCGKMLLLADGVTYALAGIDADLDPYRVVGSKHFMSIRGSDATVIPGAGLIAGTTAAKTTVLRLTNRDVGTGVNGASVVGVSQEGSLWLPPSQAWTAQFEAYVPKNSYGITKAFQEIGLMGSGDIATHFIDVSKEFGYVDGSVDEPFVALKFYNGSGYLRVRAAIGGTIQTSGAFPIPASGKHAYRIEYGYSSTGGTPAVSLYVDDVFKATIVATMEGGLQFAARACHGAAYVAATEVPPVLDLVNILVAPHS